MARQFAVVTGASTGIRLRSAIALVTPWSILAEQHRMLAEPGSGHRAS